jgi:ATP-dependent helicase HepA
VFVNVKAPNGLPRGLAKLIARAGPRATVEFFDAPTTPARIEDVGVELLEPTTLPEQTRLYHFNERLQSWRIGRLIDDHGDAQLVKFPNGQSATLPVTDVFVRCAGPIADPTPFLAAKITETPRFADARSEFVRSIVAQRGASRGMSALLSSAIELEAHQVEVVRRVLMDPVQRYLLADEVGLGKTIEAGILIRQCFLDGGSETLVLVLCPAALVPQWRAELTNKFFLGDRLDSSLHVLPLSERTQILRHLASASMLVIDEAHHFRREGDPGQIGFFDQVASAAVHLDRVLLLSATPALHNTRGFLEMLHLLDPKTYRLDDEDALRERIQRRQALAEIVASLTPDNALYLDHSLDQLVELFPQDAQLQNQVSDLRALSDGVPDESDPTFAEALGKVRAHLSELYRLHRRVLRHRRRSIGGLTPDRAGAEVIDYSSTETAELVADIEAWRVEDLAPSGNRAVELDSHVARFLDCLGKHFEHALRPVQSQPQGDALGSRVAVRLGSAEIFRARQAALAEFLRPRFGDRQQFIVFCSDVSTADSLAQQLAESLGVPVDRHNPEDASWEIFSSDPARPILVCDWRAEEGLNLQGGRKTIVHWDLPLDPNRIEQRLGRADRYGSGEQVRSILFRCAGDSYEGAWIDYLNNGLQIFSRSIASLQYLIDATMRDIRPALLEGGAEAFVDLTASSSGPEGSIEREILSLDQQDTLEALGAPPSELIDALSDVDEDWRSFERDAKGWLETTLLFRRANVRIDVRNDTVEWPFQYEYVTQQHHTLVPLHDFYSRCREAINARPAPNRRRSVTTYPLAYRRRTVLGRQGRDLHARLLRYGEPLLSGIYELAQADDRGRSTAMWRFLPNQVEASLAEVFFRFDFIVEADTSVALELLKEAGRLTSTSSSAVRRRGDMALAPSFHTLWLDSDLREVEDPRVLAMLYAPYRSTAMDDGGRDYNLNPQRWRNLANLDLPALVGWSELCREARHAAEKALRRRPALTQDLDSAARTTSEADHGRLAQLRTRVERTGDKEEQNDLKIEVALSKALLAGIRQPIVRVDGVLAVFLSGDSRAVPIIEGRS